MPKELIFHSQAQEKLMQGVNILAEAVGSTLGPRGRNIIIEQLFGPPTITKDGVTVAKETILEDKFMNMGAALVKEVASRANDAAGDGTTTATVLAHAMLTTGFRKVAEGYSPVLLKKGIDNAVAQITKELAKIARPCADLKEIAQVGSISANGDEHIGALIAEAMGKVGKEGVITVEEGKGMTDELVMVEGMQFNRGYQSTRFINTDRNTVEFSQAYVLLVDGPVDSFTSMLPVLELVAKEGAPLVVIAEEFSNDVLAQLVVNTLKGVVKLVACRAPNFGHRRSDSLSDMAVMTGATLISAEVGLSVKDATGDFLGIVDKVIVDKESTLLIGGRGPSEEVIKRVTQLREAIKESSSEYDRNALTDRVAKLAGGVATLRLGATTEVELKEKKDRVEDALHAVRAAVEEGVLPGGGVALARISADMDCGIAGYEDLYPGEDVVRQAILAPLRRIAENAGEISSDVLARVLAMEKPTEGFNAGTGEYGDMFQMGILDPAKVTRSALQAAASVAGLMLTTAGMIAIADKPSDTD
jgi:chaperonin GroEL